MTLPDGVAEQEDYEIWGKRFAKNWVRRKDSLVSYFKADLFVFQAKLCLLMKDPEEDDDIKTGLSQAREAFARFVDPEWREWGTILYPEPPATVRNLVDEFAERAADRQRRLEEGMAAFMADTITIERWNELEAEVKREEKEDSAKGADEKGLSTDEQGPSSRLAPESPDKYSTEEKGKAKVTFISDGEDEMEVDEGGQVDKVSGGTPIRVKRKVDDLVTDGEDEAKQEKGFLGRGFRPRRGRAGISFMSAGGSKPPAVPSKPSVALRDVKGPVSTFLIISRLSSF